MHLLCNQKVFLNRKIPSCAIAVLHLSAHFYEAKLNINLWWRNSREITHFDYQLIVTFLGWICLIVTSKKLLDEKVFQPTNVWCLFAKNWFEKKMLLFERRRREITLAFPSGIFRYFLGKLLQTKIRDLVSNKATINI